MDRYNVGRLCLAQKNSHFIVTNWGNKEKIREAWAISQALTAALKDRMQELEGHGNTDGNGGTFLGIRD